MSASRYAQFLRTGNYYDVRVRTTVDMNDTYILKALDNYLLPELRTIAEGIRDRAKASAAFIDQSGELRESIKVYEQRKTRTRKARAGGAANDDGTWAHQIDFDGQVVIVKASAPHAWLVEHGHGGPYPAPPHAFMRPAADGAAVEGVAILERAAKGFNVRIG